MNRRYSFVLVVMAVLFSLVSASVYAKREVVRQLGGACGEDSNILATCASGLSCKGGYCEMNSFLSSATVGCKEAMKAKGVDPKILVAAHDGFCYIDSSCRGLYEQAMHASSATMQLLRSGNRIDEAALENLSPSDREAFQAAANTCNECGQCVIGAQFLGRGSY